MYKSILYFSTSYLPLATVAVLGLHLSACNGSKPEEESELPAMEARDAETPKTSKLSAESPAPDQQNVVVLGMVPFDRDTSLDQYIESRGGINDQCDELNDLVSSVCCHEHELGCDTSFECRVVPIPDSLKLDRTAYQYEYVAGRPNYPVHHGSVLGDLEQYLEQLPLLLESSEMIPVAYTRHPIIIDDEETKNPDNKLDSRDLRAHWLGLVLKGTSERGGTRVILDYYSSGGGLLLSVAPLNEAALAQAVAELRSGTLSFAGKQLTGTGARDLFSIDTEGRLIPNRLGCLNLAQAR